MVIMLIHSKMQYASIVAALIIAVTSATVASKEPQPSAFVSGELQIDSANSYVGSGDLPSAIAFSMLVEMLEGMEISEDPAVSYALIALVQQQTAFDEASSERLLAKLMTIRSAISREVRAESVSLLCSHDLGSWSEERAIVAMTQLEEVREAVYRKHYARAAVTLDANEYQVINEWLDELKPSASYVRTDYEKAYAGKRDLVIDSLLAYCNM